MKREIQAALQRTRIVYAESDEAKGLLEAQRSDALLLPSGKYLVRKEVAEDDIRLVRAIIHEDIEALMQILQRENRYRYDGIKDIVLANKEIKEYYYDLCHNGEEPLHLSPEFMLNDIVAKALEIMFITENGLISNSDHISEDKHKKEDLFFAAIKPLIMECRHNYFREGLFISSGDSRIRSEKIRAAISSGLVFHPAAEPGTKDTPEEPRDDVKEGIASIPSVSVEAFRNFPFKTSFYKNMRAVLRVGPTKRLVVFSKVKQVFVPGHASQPVQVIARKITEDFFEVTAFDLKTGKLAYSGSFLRHLFEEEEKEKQDGEKEILKKKITQKRLYSTREHYKLFMHERTDTLPSRPLPITPDKRGKPAYIFNSFEEPGKDVLLGIPSYVKTPFARVVVENGERLFCVFKNEEDALMEGKELLKAYQDKAVVVAKFNKDDHHFKPLFQDEDGEWQLKGEIPRPGSRPWIRGIVKGQMSSRRRHEIKSKVRYYPRNEHTIYVFGGEHRGEENVSIRAFFDLPDNSDVWLNNIPEEPQRVEIRERPNTSDPDNPTRFSLPLITAFYDPATGTFRTYRNSELKERFVRWIKSTDSEECPDPLLYKLKSDKLNFGKLHGKKVILFTARHRKEHVFVEFAKTPEGKKGVYMYLLGKNGKPLILLRRGVYDDEAEEFIWLDPRVEFPISPSENRRLENRLWELGYKPAPTPVQRWVEHIRDNEYNPISVTDLFSGKTPGFDLEFFRNATAFINELIPLIKKTEGRLNIEELTAGPVSPLTPRERKELLLSLVSNKALNPRHRAPSKKRSEYPPPTIPPGRSLTFYLKTMGDSALDPSVLYLKEARDFFRNMQFLGNVPGREGVEILISLLKPNDNSKEAAFTNLAILKAVREMPLSSRTMLPVQQAVAKFFGYDSPYFNEVYMAVDEYFASIPEDMLSVQISGERTGLIDEETTAPSEDITPLALYYRRISRYPLLSPNEETELAHRISEGDTAARARFIVSNLRLVIYIAKKYSWSNIPLMDRIQEGNVGLITAVDKFDPARGTKFSTYAVWWIRQAISRHIANHARTIRLPVHMVDTITDFTETAQKLARETGKKPSLEEIADAMGISLSKVREIVEIMQEPISLETPLSEESDDVLASLIGRPDEESEHMAELDLIRTIGVEAERILRRRWSDSDDMERNILIFRTRVLPRIGLGEEIPLKEAAKRFGITGSRMQQIESACLTACKKAAAKIGIDLRYFISRASNGLPHVISPGRILRTIYKEYGFDPFDSESIVYAYESFHPQTVKLKLTILENLGIIVPIENNSKYFRLNDVLKGPTKRDTEDNIAAIYNIKMRTGLRGKEHPLDGFTVPDHKVPAVRQRIKTELLNRHLETAKKRTRHKEPCLIKAWHGYTPPGAQERMLTRICKMTRGSPFQVDFREEDPEKLVQFAIDNKENDHVVTILPYNNLSEAQLDRLKKEKAHVIFMDLEKDQLNADEVTQIGGIIAAGIAYLNNNNLAFMNIYRLLTDDNDHETISVKTFKRDPAKLRFLLKPVQIRNAEDLRHLHERMEELLVAA